MFEIHVGIPEMEQFWENLRTKVQSGKANRNEQKLYRKVGKALNLLSKNPRHPGLESHEITSLTARYGTRVWQSYLENNTPSAGRLFWCYGPGRKDITVIGIEPHPNDKNKAYDRITLSEMGVSSEE